MVGFEDSSEGPIFDPGYTPPRYPSFDPEQDGVWRAVQDYGTTVGVTWSDHADSAGVMWVTHTDAVEKMRRHFMSGARAGTPAHLAYLNAAEIDGVQLSPEFSGPLEGVSTLMKDMMADLDEARSE